MIDLLDKWCGKSWLYCLYGIGFVMLAIAVGHWQSWTGPQKVMGVMCVMLPIHVFEENTWPGGFPYMNNVAFGSHDPMVYPQNRLTNMWTNLGAEIIYILYLLVTPVWPAVAMINIIVFALGQCALHTRSGAVMYKIYKDRGKKTIYGPGSVSTYLGLVPLAVCAGVTMSGLDWGWLDVIGGILSLLLIVVPMILIPFRISARVRSRRFALTEKGCFADYGD